MMVEQQNFKGRSRGQKHMATALWHMAPGTIHAQIDTLLPVREGEVRVQTHYSAISRGTERLVSLGAVPESEWQTMRAPFQSGEFPFPVKYGYSTAGQVKEGPEGLIGKSVFCLFPHQDHFIVPVEAVVPIPEHIPLRRATMAGNMETALNAVWDSGLSAGDRVAVVGAGIVGLLTGFLCAQMPGAEVSILDVNPDRVALGCEMGLNICLPDAAPNNCDVVFHTSVNEAGLATAIGCAGVESTIVEMSWYGDKSVNVGLGGAVHSKRLRFISSQVGMVSTQHRARWTYRRRLEKAVSLLDNEALDLLVRKDVNFTDAPGLLPAILDASNTDLPPLIKYPAATT